MCGMCVLPSVVLALFTGNYGARLFDIRIPLTEALTTFESSRYVTVTNKTLAYAGVALLQADS